MNREKSGLLSVIVPPLHYIKQFNIQFAKTNSMKKFNVIWWNALGSHGKWLSSASSYGSAYSTWIWVTKLNMATNNPYIQWHYKENRAGDQWSVLPRSLGF